MRKFIALVLALALALAVSAPAFADLIWEPYDDPYYYAHLGEFEVYEAAYTTVFDTNAYVSPEGRVDYVIPAGVSFHGTYRFTVADRVWILGEWRDGATWRTVYVPADQVVDRYDREFRQDFQAEFRSEPPKELGTVSFSGEEILCWAYPGGESWTSFNFFEEDSPTEVCESFYTDPQGDVWGYVGYYMGHRDCWVCLSAPNDPNRKGVEIPAELLPPMPVKEEAHPAWRTMTVLLPIGAAAVAAALLLLWPRRKKGESECES